MVKERAENNNFSPEQQEEVIGIGSIKIPKKNFLGNKRLVVIAVGTLLVFISFPISLYLITQRQEIRKEAAGECNYQDDHPCNTHMPGWSTCDGDNRWGCDESCNFVDLPDEWREGSVKKKCENNKVVVVQDSNGDGGQPSDCSRNNESCTEKECCSPLVCDFGTCKPCSAFNNDEARCWTHAKCWWVEGSCKPRNESPPPPPGQGKITCTDHSVKNESGETLSCTASWFTCGVKKSSEKECRDDPYCGGSSTTENFTLRPGESKSFPDSSGIVCGVWQNDLIVDCGGGFNCSGSNHGCNWDEEKCSPSSPISCSLIKVYNSYWQQVSEQNLSLLRPGDQVYLSVLGSGAGIDKARFRINGGGWQETTKKKSGTEEFYINYTIPAGINSFNIEAEVHHPTQGWK